MKQLPIISIIIPVYNVEQYIEECLQSVEKQTYQGEIECVLVDDCATDASIHIAQEFINKCNGRVTYRILHHDRNRGLSAARNTGLDNAKGDYIYFLDSDDYIDANAIEVLYDAITSGDYALAISYFTKYTDLGDSIYRDDWIFDTPRIIESNEYAYKILTQQCNHASTAKLYDKRILPGTLRFIEGRINEDTLFAIHSIPIIESNHYKCIDVPLYSYHYRMREDSICRRSMCKLDAAYIENIQIFIEKYVERTELINWLKIDQLSKCVKIVRDKESDKTCYFIAVRYMHSTSNHLLRENRPLKAYIHLLLIKYAPHIMWHIEHKISNK